MSTIDAVPFEQLLLAERKRVIDAIEYLHHENAGSTENGSEDSPAELPVVTLDNELDYTLEENAQRALVAIDTALERIKAGTYGVCRSCGRPIAQERLEAIPYATLCIDCKRKDERG